MRLTLLLSLLLLTSCSAGQGKQSQEAVSTPATSSTPRFNADSAYQYVAAQCAFGPRVPGSQAQLDCAAWLTQELTRHGANVTLQEGEVTAYDGTRLPVRNIFGSFNAEAPMHVLLVSHWDSRHVSDNDPDPSLRKQPVMGANDGASGVGVLLELARLCQKNRPQVGVDILLTDVEDYGAPDDWKGSHDEKYWALGTQLWCREMAKQGYRAQYGILLDMVGAPDANFHREYYSDRYASGYVDMIWSAAERLGYSSTFINRQGGAVTDDHVFINRMLNLPCVDIIDYRLGEDGGFCPQWHTTHDTMDNISSHTLGQVGQVLVQLLF